MKTALDTRRLTVLLGKDTMVYKTGAEWTLQMGNVGLDKARAQCMWTIAGVQRSTLTRIWEG